MLLASLGETGTLVVVRNDRSVTLTGGEPGLSVVTVPEEGDNPDSILSSADAFVELNSALAPVPVILRVASGAVIVRPVLVVHWIDSDAAYFPKTVVQVGTNAEVTIGEVLASDDRDALVVPVTELDVADGARLRYAHLQRLGPRVWQIGRQVSRVGRDGTLTSMAVALGGSYARLRTDSALVGSGGSSQLQAVYFAAGEQMHDFRTLQDHRAPKTTSNLLYKGAVANRARSVYSGLIRVAKGARGTVAYQTNRNLVLHEGAHAESVPNLEIEDNDVRCSHASAVGPIAEDQRFYLESRGVPTETADRLIALGFVDEVLAGLPLPNAVAALRLELAAKLDAADRAESLVAAGGVPR